MVEAGGAGFTSYNVENDKLFQKNIDNALRELSDLRTPFKMIANDFYKSQEAIFKLKSQGKYPDFGGFNPGKPARFQGEWLKRKDAYRLRKKHEVGFDYPLLKRSGALMKSVTNPSAEGSFLNIQKTFIQIGSTIDYGKYHQSDLPREKIPQRKFLFIGPEAIRWAPDTGGKYNPVGRTSRWINTLAGYFNKKMELLGRTERMDKVQV